MTEQEIAFFDRISETWDADEHLSTPDVTRKVTAMAGVSTGHRVLDLGTGTGVLIPALREAVGEGGRVTGVDISQGMLARARKKFGTLENVRFVTADFEREDIQGEYDRIMMYCVYPHLHEPVASIRRLMSRNIRPGGTLVIAFPTDEEFVNGIHRERKAESDLLPPAEGLARILLDRGIDARVVSPRDPYMVSVSGLVR